MFDLKVNKWQKLEEQLSKLIRNSSRSDYLKHAVGTREWLVKLFPDATQEMKLAAFGHDIERCFFEKTKQYANESYIDYKMRHARRSADILVSMMVALNFEWDECSKVYYLVTNHEGGGSTETDYIRDADSLSFFFDNFSAYFDKKGREQTIEKVKFMYERTSENTKQLIKQIDYPRNLKKVIALALGTAT